MKYTRRKLTILTLILLLTAVLAGCGSKAEDAPDVEPEEEETSQSAMNIPGQETEDTAGVIEEPAELSLKDRIKAMHITYRFDDVTEDLNGDTIYGWLEDLPDGSVSVNEASAKDYVASLASRYDTFGRNRTFTDHDGRSITVTGGDYGYWMDRVSTRQELIAQILTGESAELKPVYFGTGSSFDRENDIGSTYVEINIGAQHLWVYKDGQVVNESDFVSGGLFKGNNTPEGTYSITYKERDATLVGQGYESAVKYWMPFNGNIGMHDASWRDSFGGHIYFMNGSHGCVNLPSAKAAEIYDQVEKGEPVIVYGGITKEEAMADLTMDDRVKAAQKGYIPMTTEIETYMWQQQGYDAQTAAALVAAQHAATVIPDPAAAEAPAAEIPVEQPAEEQPAE